VDRVVAEDLGAFMPVSGAYERRVWLVSRRCAAGSWSSLGPNAAPSRLTAAEGLVCALITARRSGRAGGLLVSEIMGCQYSGSLLVRISGLP